MSNKRGFLSDVDINLVHCFPFGSRDSPHPNVLLTYPNEIQATTANILRQKSTCSGTGRLGVKFWIDASH